MMKNTMKKLICCLLLLSGLCLSVFSLISCDDSPVVPYRSWSERFAELEKDWNKAGSLVSSFGEQYNVDVDELTVYDFYSFYIEHPHRNLVLEGASSQSYTLFQYNAVFPIESMLLLDQNTVCAIYRLALEDGRQTIAYVVFKREVEDSCERWEKNGELYFISERLQYADYQSINIGDSMANAIEIDPAIEFDGHYFVFSTSLEHRIVTAYRVLTDGILILEFQKDRGNSSTGPSSYTVTQKTFYPYSGTESPEDVSLTLKQLSALINN